MKKIFKKVIGLFSKPEDLEPIIELQESVDQGFRFCIKKKRKKYKEEQRDMLKIRDAEKR